MGCVFCRILTGEQPATVVAESERALAIMDINPLSDGHVLVLTKIHAETLLDVPEPELLDACRLARQVAVCIQRGLAPDGLHLIQNNGPAASQSVPHFHLHVIPRRHGDGKGFDWPLLPGDPWRIRQAADRIRAAL